MARNVSVVNARTQGRVLRRPQHSFHIRHKPFQIQPFMIAPVLPGETMRNALLQVRAVTAPVKNPLIGWWLEHYLFYVKHRDLEVDWVEDMVLDPDFNYTDHDDTVANVKYYHSGNAINWQKLCVDRIVDCYFRNEDEIGTAFTLDGMHAASIQQQGWFDSIYATNPITDVDVDGPDANTTIQASEIDAAMRQWEFMRANQLTEMSYEDFLATYGVRPEAQKLNRPELIRYSREWQYPSNTVDPATGSPSSAVSWAVAERADKDRFMPEPGFIVGVTVARPKVYLSKQSASAVSMLRDAYSWLPAIMRHDPYTSLRQFGAAAGPLNNQAAAYWVDVRDLFMYGDQFVNFALTETNAGLVALPTADLQRRFPADADVTALFADDENVRVSQDGVCALTIAGSLVDNTPTTGVRSTTM